MGILKDWFERHIIADDPYEDKEVAAVRRAVEARRAPKLVRVRQAPKRDEWTAWRDNPVTEFVMAALRRNADEHADQWHEMSWVGGEADQQSLDALRYRADALRGIAEADYEAFCITLGLEPERPEGPPHAA